MISSAILNIWVRVNFSDLKNCQKFTRAYVFQIAREKSLDYLLIYEPFNFHFTVALSAKQQAEIFVCTLLAF